MRHVLLTLECTAEYCDVAFLISVSDQRHVGTTARIPFRPDLLAYKLRGQTLNGRQVSLSAYVTFAYLLICLTKQREAAEAVTLLEQKMNAVMEKEAETWRLQEELERMKLEVDLKRQTLEAYEVEKRRQYPEEASFSVENTASSSVLFRLIAHGLFVAPIFESKNQIIMM
jgi:hypothetical protein